MQAYVWVSKFGQRLHVVWEISTAGNVELNSQNGPWIKTSGNCAIAIGFQGAVELAWEMIKTVIASLLK